MQPVDQDRDLVDEYGRKQSAKNEHHIIIYRIGKDKMGRDNEDERADQREKDTYAHLCIDLFFHSHRDHLYKIYIVPEARKRSTADPVDRSEEKSTASPDQKHDDP